MSGEVAVAFDVENVLASMTPAEKVALLGGRDFWHLFGCERLGLPSLMVTDGPHGVRKQDPRTAHLPLSENLPATCFPTASALAATWDPELVEEVGVALGEEARAAKVAVLLGPGVNIKRTPVCGRNFEYFSEDPLLSSRMAAAWIRGVQRMGIGTSLKHFAANNQEHRRYSVDARVDERALRELYLASFEGAVREAKPWTVMTAYNLLNGVYCTEHPWLLRSVLREEWGFEGVVMSDWGATVDRVEGLIAGCDLEMPGYGGHNDAELLEAVKQGRVSVEQVDTAARRMLTLIARTAHVQHTDAKFDAEAHHALARRVAAAGTVLLKNEPVAGARSSSVLVPREDTRASADGAAVAAGAAGATGAGVATGAAGDARAAGATGAAGAAGAGAATGPALAVTLTGDARAASGSVAPGRARDTAAGSAPVPLLPLSRGQRFAVVGAFAQTPRFQGAGSSVMTPLKLEDAYGALTEALGKNGFVYAQGYPRHSDVPDEELLAEARKVAAEADVVLVFAGLTETSETEGLDRAHLRMPASHDALIRAVAEVNPRLVVVLSNGAPVEMPWRHQVPAIVEGYLGGEAGGSAIVDVLFGVTEPGGRLAETFPHRWQDNPVHSMPIGPRTVEYRESVYVGYRFYDSADADVLFPFGHGLSYTTFEYADLRLSAPRFRAGAADPLHVSVTVTNTGPRAGSDVVQLYVHDVESTVFRPRQELKAFAKVQLAPGESRRVTLALDRRAFAFWDVARHGWTVVSGTFELRVGRSSRDLRARATVQVEGDAREPAAVATASSTEAEVVDRAYRQPGRGFDHDTFAKLYGAPLPENRIPPRGEFTINTPLIDMHRSRVARVLHWAIHREARKIFKDDHGVATMLIRSMIDEMSPRLLLMISRGLVRMPAIRALVKLANGAWLGGTGALLKAVVTPRRNGPGTVRAPDAP